MTTSKVTAWAVQDVVTGHYYAASGEHSFSTYHAAARYVADHPESPDLRISLAPPREMTDKECWGWFTDMGCLVLGPILGPAGVSIGVWQASARICWETVRGLGSNPCDAIRAARYQIEAK